MPITSSLRLRFEEAVESIKYQLAATRTGWNVDVSCSSI